MAYLRILKGRYYYILKSVRSGATVTSRVLEYLGTNPEPRELKRALTYWRVKPKAAKPKRKEARRL